MKKIYTPAHTRSGTAAVISSRKLVGRFDIIEN
jgi:hypothetical protein